MTALALPETFERIKGTNDSFAKEFNKKKKMSDNQLLNSTPISNSFKLTRLGNKIRKLVTHIKI